ncbi:hypothetical protein [Chryseobacterium sp. OSA05B]|uniref:hypothetical protein n=1 Tax=Chryseobacterium sp. OSA05B TaxID=2862650 RepID=UPI001CC16E8C|nr:hypothetical protein [Chryseobacterium sp. OSA05B]
MYSFINSRVIALSVAAVFCLSCSKQADKKLPSTMDSATAEPVAKIKDSISVQGNADKDKSTDQKALQIGEMIKNHLDKKDLNILTENDRKFSYSEADLNGDNDPEIFVAMKGNYFCGTGGCTVYLFNSKGEKLKGFTVVGGPVAISTNKTNGWSDLIIPSKGHHYLVKYNGKSYPGNPSVEPEFKDTLPSSFQTVLGDSDKVYNF